MDILKSCILPAIAALSAVTLNSNSAFAYRLFFGEDLNNSFSTPLTTYPNASNTEQDFLNNLFSSTTETFETVSDNADTPLTLDFGDLGTAELQGNGFIEQVPPGETDGFGRYPISGEKYWETNAARNQFSLQFSQPMAALGFHGVGLGEFGGQLQLNLNLSNGDTTTLTVPNTPNTKGSVFYFGLVAESPAELLTSLSFAMSDNIASDTFAFDNLTLSHLDQVKPPPTPPKPVPEPSTWLGLLLLGGLLKTVISKQ
ncbi:PEP-CTERM sorting domain-containing protein [Spirulina sp. CS-785/01]|uniref:PEP-CTERM sorting domain-containing protein n=1 Tax=Spirulina sp. CS-785/01 TaxID=3021716 RepID=UPI00232AA453|nr:PEP-CTERM sorting domain-containing protein [Spirulina sp. CS-785/01]MDB9314614.1 PEP-CTERM sorting domain-containing protein [Spirulina sp. CS-785/01]